MAFFFSFPSNYDRSCVYSNNMVGAAVENFTTVVLQALDLAVLWGFIRKSKFTH